MLNFTVEPWQQGLLFIDKVFVRILDSGNWLFWKGSKSVNVEKVDLRQQQIEITGQEIMSKDKVPLRLNFFCQYRIMDVKKAPANVIMRREETASTRNLLNTAKRMEENAVLYRLKELEHIERISAQVSQISLGARNQIIVQLRSLFVPGQQDKK